MTKDRLPKSHPRLRLPHQPNLVIAVVVFVSGFLAIKYNFPTVAGCTTLAGSLFGAGAAFIGAWVADRNRMTTEESERSKHQEAAIKFLAPELARIAGRLVHILDRATVNFSVESVKLGNPQLAVIGTNDSAVTFKVPQPILFPSAPAFRDLATEDATMLVNFYDSLREISGAVEDWSEGKIPWDVNAFNVLMHMARQSAQLGTIAVNRFCPEIQYSPLMPASGKLIERLQKSITHVDDVLKIHIDRLNKK